MIQGFHIPVPLPASPMSLAPEIQKKVTQSQLSLERLNQLINTFENPKVLIRPVMRKEAHSTSAIEGIHTPYEKLISGLFVENEDETLIEVSNFMEAAEFAIDQIMINDKIDAQFMKSIHKELFIGLSRWKNKNGKFREINVQIENANGYLFYPMEHGEDLNAAIKELNQWFLKTKSWDPIVAIAAYHYQFEAIHPFEDGNGRIGRLILILQLYAKGLLDYPILDLSTWLKSKKYLYHQGFQKVTENRDWDFHVGVIAAAIQGSADNLIGDIEELIRLQQFEREKVKRSFRSHSRAIEVIDLAFTEIEITVPQVSMQLGISFKSANALVSKLVAIGSLSPIGAAVYERRFKNQPLFEYAQRGF
jgi:Fic family protein